MFVHKVEWNADPNERAPVRVNPVLRHAQERAVSLDGKWLFRLDPEERGLHEQWFKRPDALRDSIRVPGCWQGQGFGDHGLDTPWDFGLPARVFRATYEGTAWYGKGFRVPAGWRDCRVWLNFGGVHPSAEVWLNGERLGGHSAPFVPFALEATRHLRFDGDNFLAVRVHEQNRWLGLAYNWAGLWSGLYRSVELTATGDAWIERLWIHPDADGQRLACRVEVGGSARRPLALALAVAPLDCAPVREVTRRVAGGLQRFSVPLPSPRLWSPDEPNLYRVDAALIEGDAALDALTERVGFLTLGARGKHFLINGEPYYMRGTGDFLAHPETGSPDTDRDRWRRKLRTLREYGYNYVRCQSYVPAPEYYDAADEVGLLVQGEMGMLGAWGGVDPWHVYPWPQPRPGFDVPLKWQWDRTVMRDVNHPSAAIYCMSNELGRSTFFPETARRCYRDTKAIKPSAFVIWTDGGLNPDLPADFVNAEANADANTSLPLIQHEFRWWSSHPDIRIKDKYRGAVRPYAIEKAEDAARIHGLHHLLGDMAAASQQLQYIEARSKMEACRRDNPRLAGICHFNAMDIGYSPQGVFDEFYERKLASGETWLRTNGDTVIMMDHDFDDRVLTAGEELRCKLSVSDFSHPALNAPQLEWQLLAGTRRVASGEIAYRHRPFSTCPAGTIRVTLPATARPTTLTLRAELSEGRAAGARSRGVNAASAGRRAHNEWRFWLFPKEVRMSAAAAVCGAPRRSWVKGVRSLPRLGAGQEGQALPRVVVAERMDERLVEHCRGGGRVILAAGEGVLRPFASKFGHPGGYFFLPPANYPPFEDGHGGTIILAHPMLGGLPHQGFADFQFYRLISTAPPIDMEGLGLGEENPVIRALSSYFVMLPLAYLMEAAIGKGGIILCALNLDQKLPEARYLLAAILRYAAGDMFRPKARLSAAALARLTQAG